MKSIYSNKDDISLRRSVEDKPLFFFDENVVKRDEIGLIIDRFFDELISIHAIY